MAKERLNRLKEPRKPFKLVILELLKKLTYLFIAFGPSRDVICDK